MLKKNATFETFQEMVDKPCLAKTEYENLIENGNISFRSMLSKAHEVSVQNCKRVMLSCCNDKVFKISATESRPLGHWRNTQG